MRLLNYIDIIYRKSDVRKKGFTRGWEVILSHNFRTGITTGFCKGTPSSDIVDCIKDLKACVLEIGHPLLLPLIIYSYDSSSKTDIKQREARDWLRRIERALSMRPADNSIEHEWYGKLDVSTLGMISRDLAECHAQVLWKRPTAFLGIYNSIIEALEIFNSMLTDERNTIQMKALQASMLSRLKFCKIKWQGMEIYADTTLHRLEIQQNRVSVSNRVSV